MQKDENSTIHRRALLQRKIDRYTEETAELEIIKKNSVFFTSISDSFSVVATILQ
jgi:hypothetical protein